MTVQYTKAEDASGTDAFEGDGRGQKYEHLARVPVADAQVKQKIAERELKTYDAAKDGTDAFANDGRGQKYEHLKHVPVVAKDLKPMLEERERRSMQTSAQEHAFEEKYTVVVSPSMLGPKLLGLDVTATEDGAALRIDAIDEVGLIDQWNKERVIGKVRVGDVILEANGQVGSAVDLLTELMKSGQELTLKLTRRYQDGDASKFGVKDEELKAKLDKKRMEVDAVAEPPLPPAENKESEWGFSTVSCPIS